jgi:hypothetical protein
VDPIRPIAPADRSVPPVEPSVLTPLEREQQRKERERKRREKRAKDPETPARSGDSGLDVRV